MNFERDLMLGKAAETLFRRWCDSAGFFSQAAVGSNPSYDLLLRATIEIKYDARANETKNFFIETHSHGKPSGVNISTATTYALITGTTCFLISIELLKSILHTLEEKSVTDGNKLGRLLPIRMLQNLTHQRIELERQFL